MVVGLVRRRALEFQGYMDARRIDLQITAYQPGQQYTPHFDWFPGVGRKSNRFSTFFVTLEAGCHDCGTEFPNVPVNWTEKDPIWCRYMDCSKQVLTSKNVVGSAIYWRNLDSDNRGRQDTLHAGLPAIDGTKTGCKYDDEATLQVSEANVPLQQVNIWTEIDIL